MLTCSEVSLLSYHPPFLPTLDLTRLLSVTKWNVDINELNQQFCEPPSSVEYNVCDAIENLLTESNQSNSFVFSIIADDAQKWSPYSLPYWLDMCGLAVPLLTIRTPSHGVDRPICNELDCSYCNVKTIDNMPGYESTQAYCLEDIFNARNASAFVYIPSVLPIFSSHYSNTSLDLRRINLYFEMEAVLYAIRNIPSIERFDIEFIHPPASSPPSPRALDDITHETVPSMVYKKYILNPRVVVDSTVIVLVFVPSYLMNIAALHTQRLKKFCETEICHIFIRYILIPSYDYNPEVVSSFMEFQSQCRDDPTAEICHDETRTLQNYLLEMVDPYHVLLVTNQMLHEIATDLDVVYVLNGLAALFSFPQPSIKRNLATTTGREDIWPSHHCEGYIPEAYYGTKIFFALPTAVTVASPLLPMRTMDGSKLHMMAVVGIADALLGYLQAVRRCMHNRYHQLTRTSSSVAANMVDYAYCAQRLADHYREASPKYIQLEDIRAPTTTTTVDATTKEKAAFVVAEAMELVSHWINSTHAKDGDASLTPLKEVMRRIIGNLSNHLWHHPVTDTPLIDLDYPAARSAPSPSLSALCEEIIQVRQKHSEILPQLYPILSSAIPDLHTPPQTCRMLPIKYMVNDWIYPLLLI